MLELITPERKAQVNPSHAKTTSHVKESKLTAAPLLPKQRNVVTLLSSKDNTPVKPTQKQSLPLSQGGFFHRNQVVSS